MAATAKPMASATTTVYPQEKSNFCCGTHTRRQRRRIGTATKPQPQPRSRSQTTIMAGAILTDGHENPSARRQRSAVGCVGAAVAVGGDRSRYYCSTAAFLRAPVHVVVGSAAASVAQPLLHLLRVLFLF
eukprot:GHVU01075096.1.p1 GENE.GHVU01075096.1~~GHVU01075096.1.p1  ORF type:complete len:130 (-),score=12.10 GHVU01075096.1:34-423(-)